MRSTTTRARAANQAHGSTDGVVLGSTVGRSAFRVTSADPPVVLLGGGANAVSVARSLGSIGVSVLAVGSAESAVRHSRYCQEFTSVSGDPGLGDEWLEALSRMPASSLLLPCDDHGLELVARRRAELLRLGLVGFEANDDVVIAMLDKQEACSLARSIGIPTPWTFPIQATEDLDRVADLIAYPCLLKPRDSYAFVTTMSPKGVSGKLFVARSRAELQQVVELSLGSGLEMIVSEIIPGRDDQLFSYTSYHDENGAPLLRFVKRKLRQYPIGFGTGSYHMSVSDPEVADLGERFFRGVGLRGLAYVEFKRDARDGALTFIECNHRFGASNDLPRHAGLDLAVFTYARLVGRPVESPTSYRTGVRLWHAADDMRAFVALRRQGELSLFGWLRSLMHPLHCCMFSVRDPRPTIGFHWQALKRRRRRTRDEVVLPLAGDG